MTKPPRRNLPPESEPWGRHVDNRIQALQNDMDLSLTNLRAAQSANAAAVSNLSFLADTGWLEIPFTIASGTYVRRLCRRVGGWVHMNIEVRLSCPVGETQFMTVDLAQYPWLEPIANTWGPCYFTSGYSGVSVMRPSGRMSVFQQTGDTRSNPQMTLAYPAK